MGYVADYAPVGDLLPKFVPHFHREEPDRGQVCAACEADMDHEGAVLDALEPYLTPAGVDVGLLVLDMAAAAANDDRRRIDRVRPDSTDPF